jgi:hypothetical protein
MSFIETQSLDRFDPVGAVTNQLYRALQTFGVNSIEQPAQMKKQRNKGLPLGRHTEGIDGG